MAGGGRGHVRLALLAGAGVLVTAGVAVVVAVMGIALFFGSAADPSPGPPDPGCGAGESAAGTDSGGASPPLPVLGSGPGLASLDADQTSNARTIVQVASALSASRGFSPDQTRRAAVIGILTALQESTLRNLGHGDRDSLGLFQQRAAWAGATERTTPSASAAMFYAGGHGGQPGLFSIPGWDSMPLWTAAQSVQVSAFPMAYAKWQRTAQAVVVSLLGDGRQTLAGPGGRRPSPSATTLTLPRSLCVGAVGAVAQPGAHRGWVLPLPPGSYTPTSPFGWRVHPILHDWRLHTGQDLGAAEGTPVYAVAAGTVVAAGPNEGYGNQVVLDHAGGVQSAYDHLAVILVPPGAHLRAGQMVGRVGSTGLSTAPHLHVEIRLAGRPVDPVPFLRVHGVDLVPVGR